MTYANSQVREAGSLFMGPVPADVDHVSGQAFPHTGITTPSGMTEHDGELGVIDLIAQENPEADAQFAPHGDPAFPTPF